MKKRLLKMRMKTILSMFIIVILGLCLLTGCGRSKETDSPKSLVLIIVNAMGRKTPDLHNRIIEESIYQAIRSGGSVSIVNADGNPSIISRDYTLDAQYAGAAKSKLDADASAATAALMEELRQFCADDPEVDLLQAFFIASNNLSDYDDDREKTIIIMDTGLSTTGDLNFCNNLISADPQVLADLLEERSCIPDLHGVHIIWTMTEALDPQTITKAQAAKIEEIWTAIIARGGGEFTCKRVNADDELSFRQPETLPVVSVVDLPEETPIQFDKETLNTDDSLFESPQFLTEEQVGFIPDTADYLDKAAALDTLSPIASYLIDHPSVTLLLAGTIAGDNNGSNGLSLSCQRAEAVKNTLISQGVQSGQLITKGLGCNDPWHIYGVGVDGPAAQQNRKVVLLDASTDQARQILLN